MSNLYLEINGDGPDLVLLHGWGLNLRVWDGLVDELRDRFRVIAVDLPGHGRSAWNISLGTPAEQAWLVHSTLAPISNRYSLLGWSLGAQIALDLTAAMPAPIERLVLVAATPRFVESADWPHGLKAETLAQMSARLRQDYRRTVGEFLELQVRGSVDGNSVLDQLRRALVSHGEARPEALAAGLRTLAGGDLRPTLAHVKTPTLVIAGQYDRITPPAASDALARALPDGRYVEIGRAAHAPFLSHRAEFAALVSDFLLTRARGSDRRDEGKVAAEKDPARKSKRGHRRKTKKTAEPKRASVLTRARARTKVRAKTPARTSSATQRPARAKTRTHARGRPKPQAQTPTRAGSPTQRPARAKTRTHARGRPKPRAGATTSAHARTQTRPPARARKKQKRPSR